MLAAAIALAALTLAVPLSAGAVGAGGSTGPSGVRAPAPAGAAAVPAHHPHQPAYSHHGGAGHPHYPYAHLAPWLVVHPGHRPTQPIAGTPRQHSLPVRRVAYGVPVAYVGTPVVYSYAPHVPQLLSAPAIAIDGDTFDSGGMRYRLYGIDTPEMNEALGPQARARLQQLLAMGPVTVIPVAMDVYGRLVAEVVVAGYELASVLRAEGFAKP